MKNTNRSRSSQSRSRNIALGAALGLVIGGVLDLLFGDSGWGLVIGILAGGLAGYFVKFPLPPMEYPAHVLRRILISFVLFLALLFFSQWLLDQDLSVVNRAIVAVLPAIPAAYLAYSIGSAIAQLDELQRRIQLEAIGIGFGASVIVTLTYALFVQAGLPPASWVFVPLVMVLFWGVGKLWTMWKYR